MRKTTSEEKTILSASQNNQQKISYSGVAEMLKIRAYLSRLFALASARVSDIAYGGGGAW